jgi:hypothetical protein
VGDSVDNLPAVSIAVDGCGKKPILIDMPAKIASKPPSGAHSLPFAGLANRFGEIPKSGASCFTATASL